MNENPYREATEQAAEHLRLALTLLANNKIPVSPFNYRMGYDCVVGSNDVLKRAMEELHAQPERSITEYLWTVYQRSYIHDDKTLDTIREELKNIITSIQRDLEGSGGKLSGYLNKLNQFTAVLTGPSSPQAMETEVSNIIEATRDAEQSQRLVNAQVSQLATDLDSLRKELAQIREESLTDSLTGVSNRKAFDCALEDKIHTARKEKSVFSVLIADIDHFKQVNDNYGHLVGDKVLRFVASSLKRCVKGKDLVARFGGEEFAVILDNTDISGASTVAEQIRQAVFSGIIKDLNNKKTLDRISISLGVAQFSASDLPNDLLQRADEALYLAKDRGRNRVEKIASTR